jgi:arylformamidase
LEPAPVAGAPPAKCIRQRQGPLERVPRSAAARRRSREEQMHNPIDISIPIHAEMPVYPGDNPLLRRWLRRIRDGERVNLSALTLGSHTGTHVDAPYHFKDDGIRLDQVTLQVLVGAALVVDIADPVSVKASALRDLGLTSAERVLFKTRNSQLWSEARFREDFVYIEPDAAEYLVHLGTRLVGIDYLSVDRYGDRSSPAHNALLGNGVVIVEGLDLSAADPGTYTLICLPLKIPGAEGAPARAILLP